MAGQEDAVIGQAEYFLSQLLLEQAQAILAKGFSYKPCMKTISGEDQFAYPEGHGIRRMPGHGEGLHGDATGLEGFSIMDDMAFRGVHHGIAGIDHCIVDLEQGTQSVYVVLVIVGQENRLYIEALVLDEFQQANGKGGRIDYDGLFGLIVAHEVDIGATIQGVMEKYCHRSSLSRSRIASSTFENFQDTSFSLVMTKNAFFMLQSIKSVLSNSAMMNREL